MNDENKFIFFLRVCEHLTMTLHSSLHPASVAAPFREAPCTSGCPLSHPPAPPAFALCKGTGSTCVFTDGGRARVLFQSEALAP